MSRFVFAGNEIIPGTVVMTADGTITPKDDLRVILNISGGGTVSLSDGTDVTQRIEIVNVSADTCSFTYKGTGGSTTASIYTNTGIRLLWVGSYWETSMSTAVTGIDDNSQPFAFNIDSLVKPDGVINLTGTDANGNPFDYGLGKLVTVADENTYSTSEQLTTKTWIDGKPIYRKTFVGTNLTKLASTNLVWQITTGVPSISTLVNWYGSFSRSDGVTYAVPTTFVQSTNNNVDLAVGQVYSPSANTISVNITGSTAMSIESIYITVEYTKTTD